MPAGQTDHAITRPVILIVDDDPILRSLLRDELEDSGFLVREAENGLEALEICAEESPALLVVDAVMPFMDGFTLCQEIRLGTATQHVPILMATGLLDVDSIKRAFEAGATDFITKPLNWVIVTQRVRYMLRTARIADDLRESEDRLHAARLVHQTHAKHFEAALDNMSQGLCMVGDDGRVIVTNQRFLDLYMIAPSSVKIASELNDTGHDTRATDGEQSAVRRHWRPAKGELAGGLPDDDTAYHQRHIQPGPGGRTRHRDCS